MASDRWHPNEFSGLRHELNQLFDYLVKNGKQGDGLPEDLVNLQGKVNRLLDYVRKEHEDEEWFQDRWLPPVDVVESDDEIVVTAELPGIRDKKVKVAVQEDMLKIQGEKKQQTREGHSHQAERRYGSFNRSVRLPARVKTGKIDTRRRNGVLTLKLKKDSRAKPKKIKVKES